MPLHADGGCYYPECSNPTPRRVSGWRVGGTHEYGLNEWQCEIFCGENYRGNIMGSSDSHCMELATKIVEAVNFKSQWDADSSLEKWFPFSAEELYNLRAELNTLRGGGNTVSRATGVSEVSRDSTDRAPENFPAAFAAEIKRNEKLVEIYRAIPTGGFGHMMIQRDIDAARVAMLNQDTVAMLRAFAALKGNK